MIRRYLYTNYLTIAWIIVITYLSFGHFSQKKRILNRKVVISIVQVNVRENNVEQALRVLKKKLQREGVFREMKKRRHYEKPSERKKRENSENIRRSRKLERKKRGDF